MRIRRLDLNNFGAFAHEQINLEHVQAACVSGANGSGKSTLFMDAVRWALFGKCRTQTDLMLRLGQQTMSVGLVFSLGTEVYQVVRKRSVLTKAGKSELVLQQLNKDMIRDIGGSRLADTQAKIEELLRADDDLLTSTAFLVQGEADRFSRSTPGNRKGILASILNLSRYAELDQAARSKRQYHAVEQGRLRGIIDQASEGLETSASLTFNLESMQLRLESHYAEKPKVEELLKQEMAKQLELQVSIEKRLGVTSQIKQLDEQMQAQKRDLENKNYMVINAEALAAESSQIEELEASEKEKKEALQVLQKKEAELEEHRAAHDLAQKNMQKWHKRAEEVRQELQAERQSIMDLVDKYRRGSEGIQLRVDQMKREVELLAQVPCSADLQAKCQFTISAFKAQQELPAKEQSLSERPADEEKIMAIVRPGKPSQVLQLQQGLDGIKANLKGLEEELEPLLERIQSEQRITRQKRMSLEQELRSILELLQRKPLIQDAQARLPELRRSVETVKSLIQDLQNQSDSLTVEAESIARQSHELADLKQNVRNAQDAKDFLSKTIADMEAKITATKAEIAKAEARELQVSQATKELERVNQEHSDLGILSELYKLIPVLIMESAIPTLEAFANAFLDKVSARGMQVTLQTQKALKSTAGISETLDIIVRDVVGERPYENYSGGEKFRLDLALRIGLSKLLASRSSARLETLVIDEGFGSLDEDGLSRFKECLPALWEDFPLVLAITHVESLRHAMPAEIAIETDENGSHAHLIA